LPGVKYHPCENDAILEEKNTKKILDISFRSSHGGIECKNTKAVFSQPKT
jgi:hypothetical protein